VFTAGVYVLMALLGGICSPQVAGHVILDMSLLSDISITTPTEATTLHESFSHLELERGSFDSSVAASGSKRPSLASSHKRSSESTTASIKRKMSDALLNDLEEDQADGSPLDKKRMFDIVEEPSKAASSSSKDSKDTDGDQDMSRSGSGTGSGTGSGSGSRSGRGSRDGREGSTPATSNSGHEPLKMPDAGLGRLPPTFQSHHDPSPTGSSSSSSAAGPSAAQGRIAYVNPSPTTTSAFPFIPTTFGTGTTSSISYNSALGDGYPGGNTHLVLNTNPDPPPYTIVTFGAGVKSKQLDSATASSPYGAFHVPTSAFPVGAGQFVLGGFGFVGRRYGLAMDNLVEAEMVLADGRIVWVGEGGAHGGDWKDDEDPEEVWWGIRGAGPSLGVITRFRAKAYYIPSVYAGNLI
jgi:hypothetical protein